MRRIAAALLFLAGPVVAASYQEIDALYLQRHKDGRLARSTALLEARLKEAPEDAQALWRLGRNLVRIGEARTEKEEKLSIFERAEALIERSVRIAPENAEAHFWHGLALGRRGETRGILRSLFMIGPLKRRMGRVLELDARHGGAHHVLGMMLYRLPRFVGGSKQEAVKELETALRLTPAYTAHYPALAEAYLAVGQKEKARAVLDAFFAVAEPSDPAVYDGHRAEVEKLRAVLRP